MIDPDGSHPRELGKFFGSVTETSGIMMDEIVAEKDNIITLAYLCGGTFLSLVALAMTNKIIIYGDVADFIWSLAIVLTPILTPIALAMVAPEEATDTENLFGRPGNNALFRASGRPLSSYRF